MGAIKFVETTLLVLLLSCTAANIGMEARYLMRRYHACIDLKRDDCDHAKG